jgi:hypothetical protein
VVLKSQFRLLHIKRRKHRRASTVASATRPPSARSDVGSTRRAGIRYSREARFKVTKSDPYRIESAVDINAVNFVTPRGAVLIELCEQRAKRGIQRQIEDILDCMLQLIEQMRATGRFP